MDGSSGIPVNEKDPIEVDNDPDGDHATDEQKGPVVNQLRAEIERLLGIVRTLPRAAGGEPIMLGHWYWVLDEGGYCQSWRVSGITSGGRVQLKGTKAERWAFPRQLYHGHPTDGKVADCMMIRHAPNYSKPKRTTA